MRSCNGRENGSKERCSTKATEYQLRVIAASSGDRKPDVEVSWQIAGIRQGARANAHRIPLEVLKAEADQGHYPHSEAIIHEPTGHRSRELERYEHLSPGLKHQTVDLIVHSY